MRREMFRMAPDAALAFLGAAPAVQLAATDGGGRPMLKTVHVVALDGAFYFHGAPAGEKLAALGREAVLGAEEIVAEIPSYFRDPERACPATTLYRSVQAHGVLEEVDALDAKGRALQALMERFQPEGGHVPISGDHPLYARALAGLLVARLRPRLIDGKAKLMQQRPPDEVRAVATQLWRRGRRGDARAAQLICDANQLPLPFVAPLPPPLALTLTPPPGAAAAVAALLADTYWNRDVDAATLARAHQRASAWLAVYDGDTLVASARALSDGAKWAWIYDVIVAPAWRGRGLGQALVAALLDHPEVRGARRVRLSTRDAAPLYARFGFELSGTSWLGYTEMTLTRSPPGPTLDLTSDPDRPRPR